MDKNEKHLARVLFQNKIYKSDNQAFEDLVVLVLQHNSKSFITVKPQGRYGDRKNDGFDSITNKYYQIYGPEDLPKKENNAVNKLNEDFEGLKNYWEKNGFTIREFNYVVNDKYKGLYPEIINAIQALKNSNPNIEICLKRAFDIEDIFLNLDEQKIIDIVGIIPSAFSITDVDYTILTQVVDHILAFNMPDNPEEIPIDPDFEEKLIFNGISSNIADILRFAYQQTYVVNDFFNTNSNFAKEELRKKFEGLYNKGKKYFHNLSVGPIIFFSI